MSDKITINEVDEWFPNGIPLVAMKIMFPEKSKPLTTNEVRFVMYAISTRIDDFGECPE